ncbi:MAG TPA: ABC transporter substrate-binding protein [Herpetosiphonaceae bacterium]|nr:ABC transporter substrate-binding protein [Herpetosiphonaceae bacterium]
MDTHRHRHFSLGAVILTAFTILLSACGSGSPPANAGPPLKFGHVLWAGNYPFYIAQAKGYFADSNVEAVPLLYANSDTMMGDFVAGNYDIVSATLGDGVIMFQADNDIHIIAVLDESNGADALIASPQATHISDLRGQRIGVNLGTFGELFVITVLGQHQLTPNDVILVDIDANQVPDEIASGNIVAGHTWEPHISEARRQGQILLFDSTKTPGLINDVLIVRGEVARKRPEAVKAFIKAWFQGVDYWMANPAEGTRLIATATNQPPESISLDGIKLNSLSDNHHAFASGTTSSLYETTQTYIDFFARFGAIRQPPAVTTLLDPGFLPKP